MRKFVAGVVFVYVGFVLYFLGLVLAGAPNPILDTLTSLIPPIVSASFTPIIFEFLGGLIGVTGFLLCAIPAKPPPPAAPQPPTIIIQKVPEPAAPAPPNPTAVPKCKFCGSPVQEGSIFCPSCNRAQT